MKDLQKSPRDLLAGLSGVAANEHVIVFSGAVGRRQHPRGAGECRFTLANFVEQMRQFTRLRGRFIRSLCEQSELSQATRGFAKRSVGKCPDSQSDTVSRKTLE